MNRLWKDFRTNLMYWRFRHITRNRLRLQSWYRQKRPVRSPRLSPTPGTYRPRGTAMYVKPHSSRQTWLALVIMVALLTAIRVVGSRQAVSPTLVYAVSALIVVGGIYWALRGL